MAKKRPSQIKRTVSARVEPVKASTAPVASRPTPAVADTVDIASVPAKTSNRFFTSTSGKVISGLLIFFALFTVGYGIWRLMGGSFKPKTNCPDVAVETRLRDTASANPTSFNSQLEYGTYLYNQCRRFDGAIVPLQAATRLADQPNTNVSIADKAKAHLTLGLAYLYNQNSKEAKAEFTTTVSLEPENPLGLYMLASTLKSDDPKQALSLFKKAAELEPNGDLGKATRQQIEELSGK